MNAYGLTIPDANPYEGIISDEQYDVFVNTVIARYFQAKEYKDHYSRFFNNADCAPVVVRGTYEKGVYYDASWGKGGRISMSMGFTVRVYLLMRLLYASVGEVEEASTIQPQKIVGTPDLSPLVCDCENAEEGLRLLCNAVPTSAVNDHVAWHCAIQATVWAMFHEMFHGFAEHARLGHAIGAATDEAIQAARRRRRDSLRKHLWQCRFGLRNLSTLHEKSHAFNELVEVITGPAAANGRYKSEVDFYEAALKRDEPELWAGKKSLEAVCEYEADQTALCEVWVASRMNSECFNWLIAGAVGAYMLVDKSPDSLDLPDKSGGYPNACRRHRIASGLTNKRASEILGADWVFRAYLMNKQALGEALDVLLSMTKGGEHLAPWVDYLLQGSRNRQSFAAMMLLREKQAEDVWMYGRYLLEEATGFRIK